MTQHEIWLPPVFIRDHIERDLPFGEIVREGPKGILIRCSDETLDEIRSDADYYSDCAGQGWDFGPDALGLQSSAQATVRRIDAYRGTRR